MRWSRKARQRAEQARKLREQAERAERDAHERVVVPMRKMRKQNHVVEDIVHLIRRGGAGEPG